MDENPQEIENNGMIEWNNDPNEDSIVHQRVGFTLFERCGIF